MRDRDRTRGERPSKERARVEDGCSKSGRRVEVIVDVCTRICDGEEIKKSKKETSGSASKSECQETGHSKASTQIGVAGLALQGRHPRIGFNVEHSALEYRLMMEHTTSVMTMSSGDMSALQEVSFASVYNNSLGGTTSK